MSVSSLALRFAARDDDDDNSNARKENDEPIRRPSESSKVSLGLLESSLYGDAKKSRAFRRKFKLYVTWPLILGLVSYLDSARLDCLVGTITRDKRAS